MLQEKIASELSQATISRNIVRRDFLKVVVGELNRMESKQVSDADVLKLLKKMRENAVIMKNNDEILICDEFLPQNLSEVEITDIIKQIIEDNNCTSVRDMGKIMSGLNQHPDIARIDRKLASDIVKKLLFP